MDVERGAMSQAAFVKKLLAVVARDDHDGVVQVHFLQGVLIPNIHIHQSVLVAIDDLVFPVGQIRASVFEIISHFRQIFLVFRFINVIVGIVRRMVERINQPRSLFG